MCRVPLPNGHCGRVTGQALPNDMPTDKPVVLRDLIRTDAVAGISEKIERSQKLASLLRDAFPNDVKPHLLSADVHDDRLVLVADHAVWAARMRYYTSDVLQIMVASHNLALSDVTVRVRPTRDPHPPTDS